MYKDSCSTLGKLQEFIFQSVQEILSFEFVLPKKRLNRDTKLIAILRRQFCIILTALEENIFSVLIGRSREAEYIFFQRRQYNAELPSQNRN